MAILSFDTNMVGQEGVTPKTIKIDTNSTEAQVLALGFLNPIARSGITLSEDMLALVTTRPSPASSTRNVGTYEISIAGEDYSLVPSAGPGSVLLPTRTNFGAHFTDTQGTLSDADGAVSFGGDIGAGYDGVAGKFVSYPGTANAGTLSLEAADSVAGVETKITNASHGQSTTYTLLDPGQPTANFITSESTGTQNINSGNLGVLNGQITAQLVTSVGLISALSGIRALSGDVEAQGGDIVAGSDGTAGTIKSYPNSASNGTMNVSATNNPNGFDSTITNSDVGLNSTYTLPNVGLPNSYIVTSGVPVNGTAEVVNSYQSTGSAAVLAGGGTTTIINNPSSIFFLQELIFNVGTNFAGGDRDLEITDGTNAWSIIPAAFLQAQTNARWGDANLPLPVGFPIFSPIPIGVSLIMRYTGGTTDYASGSAFITARASRIF